MDTNLLFSLLHSLPINEEILDSSSTTPQSTPIFIEPIAPCLRSISLPNSPLDNRRTSIRQQKRRTFRDPKDLSISTKKRNRLDIDINSNFHHDSTNNSDISPTTTEQQSAESMKKSFFFIKKFFMHFVF